MNRRVLLPLLCGILFVGAPHEARPEQPGRAPSSLAAQLVTQRNETLRQRWSRVGLQEVKSVSRLGGKSAQVHAVDTTHGLFIVRVPRRRVRHGLRVNTALQLLATELGEPRMVPGCAKATLAFDVGNIPSGSEVMLMSHVGKRYIDGDRADGALRAIVSNPQRLAAALVDFLSVQGDRKPANMMLHPERGTVRLPDPDNTFGAGLEKPKIFASVFFPGGRFAYAGQQKSLTDLPQPLAELVGRLATSTLSGLQSSYGLSKEEAFWLHRQAGAIQNEGLDRAIENFLGQFQLHSRR